MISSSPIASQASPLRPGHGREQAMDRLGGECGLGPEGGRAGSLAVHETVQLPVVRWHLAKCPDQDHKRRHADSHDV